MIEESLRIYVSGPISADTHAEVLNHYRLASKIAEEIKDKGHLVFLPHTTIFDYPNCSRLDPVVYEKLLYYDLSIVRYWANALFFIAPSPGANRELALAEELKHVIFRHLGEVPRIGGDNKSYVKI